MPVTLQQLETDLQQYKMQREGAQQAYFTINGAISVIEQQIKQLAMEQTASVDPDTPNE
ncbi:MAG: hypothetical protein WC476_12480 [Phycisphaerae bacterium]|jgi:hypothetical protein